MLLRAGANSKELDKNNDSLLHKCPHPNLELVIRLISYGVPIEQTDNKGNMPLHKFVSSKFKDFDYSEDFDATFKIINLLSNDEILAHKNNNGETPLIVAGKYSDPEIYMHLLKIMED